MLSKEEVLKIARLARLQLTDAEVEVYRTRLGRVLDYVRELGAIKTEKEDFVRHIPKDAVAFREDRAISFSGASSLLDNAPEKEKQHYLLPPVFEHEE